MKKKTGRNDPCPCGSGKKFKKCCESKMIGGRYMATKIQDTEIKPRPSLTNFFQSRISAIAKPSDVTRSLKPSAPAEEKPPETAPPSEETNNKEIEP